MKKEKYTLEYPLKKASETIVWKFIGTSVGLAQWFADDVIENDDEFTFLWENYEEKAILLRRKKPQVIRFQREEDIDTNVYFQFEIIPNKMMGTATLFVTDFAESDEKEDDILMWNKQIEALFRLLGL